MRPGITVVIPTIPPRKTLLDRAVRSVEAQTLRPYDCIVVEDVDHNGAAVTRQNGLEAVETEWVAFLDDDDELLPNHLEALAAAWHAGADLLYPWFHLQLNGRRKLDNLLVVAGEHPFGRPFDKVAHDWLMDSGNFIPVTVMVRTGLLLEAGGFPTPGTPEWPNPTCEDWGAWQNLLRAGARFHHVPERTWVWHHHKANTSGLPW